MRGRRGLGDVGTRTAKRQTVSNTSRVSPAIWLTLFLVGIIFCHVEGACFPVANGGGCGTEESCNMNDAGFCNCGRRKKDCYCTGLVRFGAPTIDMWVPTQVQVNGSIYCHEDMFEDLEVNANLECECCVRNDSCAVPTTSTTTPAITTTTTAIVTTTPARRELKSVNTSSAHITTSAAFHVSTHVATPPPTTIPLITNLSKPLMTNVSMATNASILTTPNITTSPRQIMDRAAVQALTDQATVVVATTVAVAMGASMAGAASGPGVLAIIGQVQMLSQTGKIGGGKTSLGQMSDSFEWANGELPFSPWLIISDGLSMRRSQFQRRKNKIPPPGQTQKSFEKPEVRPQLHFFVEVC